MLYMVTFTINIPPMLAYIPYMDPMRYEAKLWAIKYIHYHQSTSAKFAETNTTKKHVH
jgi:hypothetical protein